MGFVRNMGHVSAALLACKIGYVSWHIAPWILETTNLQSFLNKVKGLVYGLTGWRSAHVTSLWVSSKATYEFPIFLFLLSPPLPPHPSPLLSPFFSYSGYGHLSGSNCGLWRFCQSPRENRPSPYQWPTRNPQAALDNGKSIFPRTKPREADSFAPGRLEDLLPS